MNVRGKSIKFPTWRGTVNSGYYVRSMAAEWYVTLIVGTARPGARDQRVELSLDTGSEFTWLQCRPCHKCFPQQKRLFNPRRSTTFILQTHRDDFCRRVQRMPHLGIGADADGCGYSVEYLDGGQSEGEVCEDYFESINDINNGYAISVGFGCGTNNVAQLQSGAGGVLGLLSSRHRVSFAEQVELNVGALAFSYCLTSLNEPADSGYLMFGQAAVPTGAYPSTPFVQQQYVYFFVDVIDLSVNGVRLGVPPGTFDLDSQHNSGVMVDTGAPYSIIHAAAFDRLIAMLIPVFSPLGMPYYPPNRYLEGPCWGAKDLDLSSFPFPRIAWHFRDGNVFQLSVSATYVLYKTQSKLMSLCLPFLPNTDPGPVLNVMGGHSQINTLMYFDIPSQRLGWVPDAC
ncbi:hypothetical protein Mapa_011693 [Marchantia paleacea]|nr:hypothetical protein Mapa_011693 [Marchantia paleacea]